MRSDQPDRGEALPPGATEVRRPRVLLHAALFLLTFLTTTASGAIRQHPGADFPFWQVLFPVAAIRPISDGLTYSVPLMLILLCHELGHYVAARAHGVAASLPYFIPLPPLLGFGTLGAVIGMSHTTGDRRKLIDIGAAGPLAGLAVAVPVIVYGLMLSPITPRPPGFQEGNSLLYAVLKRLTTGAWLPSATEDVNLHPIAFAGWTGLLVTMINLLPIGQLDGGHVASAYFGDRYQAFSRRLHQALPLVAGLVFAWVLFSVRREARGGGLFSMRLATGIAVGAALPWMLWWGMVALVRRATGSIDHPPLDPAPLPPSRHALFWLMVAVFVLVFMPVPMRATLAGAPVP